MSRRTVYLVLILRPMEPDAVEQFLQQVRLLGHVVERDKAVERSDEA